jgi:hypothetical protein
MYGHPAGSYEVNNLVLTLFSPATPQIWGINSISRHKGIFPNNIFLTIKFGVA